MLVMKKLALALATLAAAAAPVVACPGHEDAQKTAEKDQPVRTADKDKKAAEPATEKKTEAPKKADQKADQKTGKADPKKPDKVSTR